MITPLNETDDDSNMRRTGRIALVLLCCKLSQTPPDTKTESAVFFFFESFLYIYSFLSSSPCYTYLLLRQNLVKSRQIKYSRRFDEQAV